MIAVETFPRHTVWPGYYVVTEDYPGGESCVHEITHETGVARRTEPLLLCPDRATAERHVTGLLAHLFAPEPRKEAA